MIDKHAPQIVTVEGQPSPETIEPCSVEASDDGQDDPATLSAPVGCANTGALPIGFPLPESNPMALETRTNASLNRESENATWQFPATRSIPRQPHENTQKSASQGSDSRVWVTDLGHSEPTKANPTLSNRSGNRPEQWVTRSGHKRSTRGLSLRGSVYQFRVRVPADLRAVIGSSHVKRSLRTDSHSQAVRLSRKVAFEIDMMFEAKRRERHFSCRKTPSLDRALDHCAIPLCN